jgi:hypothetical protein
MALANHLGACLAERQKQCKEIQLAIVFEDSSIITAAREFTKQMSGFGSLLTGLRLTMRQIPIHAGVQSLSVSLKQVAEIDSRQIVIPGSRIKDGEKDVVAEQADQTVRKLQQQYGETNIERADKIEASRSQLVMRAWKEATGW